MAAQYTPPRRDQKGIAGTLSILGTTLRARSRVRSSNDAPSRGILTAETHQTVENQSEALSDVRCGRRGEARGHTHVHEPVPRISSPRPVALIFFRLGSILDRLLDFG